MTYFPLFKTLAAAANPQLAAASERAPVSVIADPADCSFQFDPVGRQTFASSCDVAKSHLASAGISYESRPAPAGSLAVVQVGQVAVNSFDGEGMPKAQFDEAKKTWQGQVGTVLSAAGYPAKADPAQVNRPLVVGVLFVLMLYVTMVYGPIAAALVEMFPARIRYTSMSLPYHVGNGWFGGFLPPTAFAMVAASGNIYFGLWYPITVAAVTLVVGLLFLKEMRGAEIEA
jgi:hypothetical protein